MIKTTLKNFLFFSMLFTMCLLGSVVIFVFAVGMETGNKIVTDVMTILISNAGWVFALFGFFNFLIWFIYTRRTRQ